MTEAALAIWKCRASCKDGSSREVLGVYKGDRCLLVSRPWISPANVPIHAIALRSRYSLLCVLMSVADYHEYEGLWFGELATSWMAISALVGVSRNTMNGALTELSDLGYIKYTPATNRWVPSLIRVLPVNQKTGDRLLQVTEPWLSQWVVSIEPIEVAYTVDIKEKVVDHIRQAPMVDSSALASTIGNSPIYIPDASVIQPKSWAAIELTGGNLELFSTMKQIPGFEDAMNLTVGIDKGTDETLPAQELGRKDTDTHQTWVREGYKVEIHAPFDPPQPGQVGGADLPAQELGRHPRLPLYQEDSIARVGIESSGGSPTSGLLPGAAPSAPPPPPAGAPPSAAALFVGHRSQRKLQPGQVEKVLKERGERVGDADRLTMTSKQTSCIDYYERMSGVPFCAADLPHLNRALEITSHSMVLLSIKDCSVKWPKTCPGYYVVTMGMKHILNNVEATVEKRSKGRGKGKAVSTTDSGKAKRRLEARSGSRAASAAVPAQEGPQGPAKAPSKGAEASK